MKKCVLTTPDARNKSQPEKRAKKIARLTTANELFHKITVFITFQESEKVCFNYTRHSKRSTPQKTRKKNSQFNYRKHRFVKNDGFRNIA